MGVINYLIQNAGQLMSIISLLLGVAVAIAHLLNKSSVESSLQNIQSTISSLEGKNVSGEPKK